MTTIRDNDIKVLRSMMYRMEWPQESAVLSAMDPINHKAADYRDTRDRYVQWLISEQPQSETRIGESVDRIGDPKRSKRCGNHHKTTGR
jgi:hypothetical protein